MSSVTASPKLKVTVQADFDSVAKRLRQVLAAGGFDILFETGVQQLAGERTDAPTRPYRIFGVNNADIAHRAYIIAPESSLLLPYNLMAAEIAENLVEVSWLDPRVVFNVVGSPYLRTVAEELYSQLNRIIEAIAD